MRHRAGSSAAPAAASCQVGHAPYFGARLRLVVSALLPKAEVAMGGAHSSYRLGLFDTCPRVEMAHRTAPV